MVKMECGGEMVGTKKLNDVPADDEDDQSEHGDSDDKNGKENNEDKDKKNVDVDDNKGWRLVPFLYSYFELN